MFVPFSVEGNSGMDAADPADPTAFVFLADRATAESARIEPLLSTVMRGLDPRIHLLAKRMDCRVKPGNDNRFNMTGNRYSFLCQ
jgi:hypothetical protein